ncbi:MAG: O-acetylhomoserine aminocarboxypropyltransferase/cysteine synthase family protein [Candidatus Polarisedimenticolia bacterium]
MPQQKPRFETLQVHAGNGAAAARRAAAPPIFQTTSFTFDDCAHGAGLFALDAAGHIYSRLSNPTVAAFEERVAALEGGAAAVATASGQAAIFLAVAALAAAGDNIVAANALYGGTHSLFRSSLARLGVDVRLARGVEAEAFEPLIDERTKGLYVESIGNPGFDVPEFDRLAALAHGRGLPLVVDNTFGAAGWYARPIDHGADVVVASATKWIGGHGAALGGVIVDADRFDWAASGRFAEFVEPAAGYHGLRYAADFGRGTPRGGAPLAARVRLEGLRDFGPCLAPQNAFLRLLGRDTLSLRAERQAANALALARWLEERPEVAWVRHPGLPSHPHHARARRYFPRGAGAAFSFGLVGGAPAGRRFIEARETTLHLANVGDVRTLAIHPASTTHAQLSPREREAAGVSEDLVRVSAGVEHVEDLRADFERALAAARGEAR